MLAPDHTTCVSVSTILAVHDDIGCIESWTEFQFAIYKRGMIVD